MALSSYDCKGCTNIVHCYISDGQVFEYCRPGIEGRQRKKWQGDHLACLDYTTDPAAEDKVLRPHPDIVKE